MTEAKTCYALYASYRRFETDLEAMSAGAFFAPLSGELPPIFSSLAVRLHLPDGMRCVIAGEVIQQVPGRGVIIGLNPRDPVLDSMRQAVQRSSYQEQAQLETAPGALPRIGFTDPVHTVRTKLDPRASGELRTRFRELLESSKPDHRD